MTASVPTPEDLAARGVDLSALDALCGPFEWRADRRGTLHRDLYCVKFPGLRMFRSGERTSLSWSEAYASQRVCNVCWLETRGVLRRHQWAGFTRSVVDLWACEELVREARTDPSDEIVWLLRSRIQSLTEPYSPLHALTSTWKGRTLLLLLASLNDIWSGESPAEHLARLGVCAPAGLSSREHLVAVRTANLQYFPKCTTSFLFRCELMVSPGPDRLFVVPEDLLAALPQSTPEHAGALWEAVLLPGPAVLETLLALWDPQGEGSFATLEGACAAASLL